VLQTIGESAGKLWHYLEDWWKSNAKELVVSVAAAASCMPTEFRQKRVFPCERQLSTNSCD
jgi:hypothetical protein